MTIKGKVVPIVESSALEKFPNDMPILIASRFYQQEITIEIKKKYGRDNPLILLF